MSEKYKEAMDKIVVSDELKAKIINNAVLYNAADKPKSKRSGFVYLRYGMGYAACLALCLYAVSTSDNYINTHDFQAVSVTAEPKAAAESDDEMPKNVNIAAEIPTTANAAAEMPKKSDVKESVVKRNNTVKNNKSNNSNKLNKAAPIAERGAAEVGIQSSAQVLPDAKPQLAAVSLPNEDTETVLREDTEAVLQSDRSEQLGESSGANVMSASNKVGGAEPVCSTYMTRSVVEPKISSIEDIENSVGYRIKTPQYMPDGYKLESVGVIADSTVQMSYTAPDDEITYRTEKNDSGEERDISGNYEEYENVSTENINGNNVTIKSSGDSYYNAVWNDDSSYSLDSSNGIEKDDMVRIIESVDYCESEKIPNSIDIME